MSTNILAYRIAELECYICGSTEIKMLCHNCKRPICSIHGPESIPQGDFFRRIVDVEFTNLDLLDFLQSETGVHCEDCNKHYIKTIRWTRIFIILSLLFLLLGLLTPSVLWAVLFITGTSIFFAMSVIRFRTRYKRLQKEFQLYKPPLPIVGQFISIAVREALEISLTLTNEGDYTYKVEENSPRGKIEISSFLSEDDHYRFRLYQKKYQLPYHQDIDYHAGFVVLRGESKFYENQSYSRIINPIALTNKLNINDFAVGAEQRTPWHKRLLYSFNMKGENRLGLPVQVVPTLISESKNWSIQIFLQTNPSMDLSTLSSPKISRFKLIIQREVKGIENRNPYGKIEIINTDQEHQNWQIVWENIDLEKVPKREIYKKYLYFRIQDSENVTPDMIISGEIELLFDGTLSGFQDVEYYSPLGGEFRIKENKSITKLCKIKISFEFSLAGLKLHEVITKSQQVKKTRAIPEPDAITRLVNVMSEEEFYVQRVIENLPGSNQADARILKRLWVISGYYYEKKQPINFRIVAQGIEQYDNADEPYDGKTDFYIVVRGVISDDDMEEDLIEVQDKIVKLVKKGPELEVEWLDREFSLGKWEKFCFKLISMGEDPLEIEEVFYSLNGPSVKCEEQIESIPSLPEKGGKLDCSVDVFFGTGGDVPIILQVVCRDKHGKFAPLKWRHNVIVN